MWTTMPRHRFSSHLMLASTVLLLLLAWSPHHHAVTACSCVGPITFNNALRNDRSTLARVRIRKEIFPNGPLDPVGNGFRYFRATIVTPYRGCRLSSGKDIIVSNGGNSALCGLDLKVRTDYLMEGGQQDETLNGLGVRNVLQVSSCSFNVPFSQLTREQKDRLARFPKVDNCRPQLCDNDTKCGPIPPVAPPQMCPDGSETFYDITCRQATTNPSTYRSTKCNWDIWSSTCPECDEDADCSFASYCSAGLCRTRGTCATTADCYNPSSLPLDPVVEKGKPVSCLEEERECNGSGICETNCCPADDIVQCFADPCDVLTIQPDPHVCVSNFCGGCNAYAFDKAGNQVNSLYL